MAKENKEKQAKTKDKKVKTTMIGGQALMEGVMMRGAKSMAMAVRAPDGTVELEAVRTGSGKKWYKKVPIIRGVCAFVSSMVSGVKTLLKSAEVSSPEEEMPGKAGMTLAVVLGVVFAVGLFILLPSLLTSLLGKLVTLGVLWSSLIEGLVRLVIFILYLLLVSRMKDIRRTFMYHGAEHRTINCYERGLDMTVENVQKCSTRHNRCGTTFLFFVMVISILIFSLANWIFSLFNISLLNNMFIKMLIRLALLPFVAGLSYELLRFLAVLPDNWFVNIFRAPGLALQRLTTYPPDDDMAEIALISFKAVLLRDNDDAIPDTHFHEHSMAEVRQYIGDKLSAINAEEAEIDWILCEALNVKRGELVNYKVIGKNPFAAVKEIVKRRQDGEPLDYITGNSYFFGLKLKVTDKTLIPRMDTEVLCERAIELIGDRTSTVLDLCTGSGCIAAAIEANTNAAVTASDISESALETAKQNLKRTEIVLGDMFSGLKDRKFDLIISNPPYIPTLDLENLSKEVRRQPRLALDGGEDGLNFYRKIAVEAKEHLNDNGVLLLEIGYNQAQSVEEILSGYKGITVHKDLDGNDRVVEARL